MKYRKKLVVDSKMGVAIEATRWFKNGDHPDDGPADKEGKVVRYFVHPKIPGTIKCLVCSVPLREHGWIDTLEGGHTVCPGDWIITGVEGERYPVKDSIFEQTYEQVEE